MAFSEFSRPYEALIRYEDGLPKAIELIKEVGVIKDGDVIQRSESLAQPVDVESFALSDLIGQTCADALIEITRLREIISEKEMEIEQFVQANGGNLS